MVRLSWLFSTDVFETTQRCPFLEQYGVSEGLRSFGCSRGESARLKVGNLRITGLACASTKDLWWVGEVPTLNFHYGRSASKEAILRPNSGTTRLNTIRCVAELTLQVRERDNLLRSNNQPKREFSAELKREYVWDLKYLVRLLMTSKSSFQGPQAYGCSLAWRMSLLAFVRTLRAFASSILTDGN